MKTSFPFASFEWEQNFATAVQVPEPLSILRIGEMRPCIIVNLFKPLDTLPISSQGVAFDQAYQRFDMDPPEFLVPFELLQRVPFDVHKIENTAILLIPPKFQGAQHYVHSFFGQFRAVEPHRKVHDKPHGLDGMAWVEQPPLKRIGKTAVG